MIDRRSFMRAFRFGTELLGKLPSSRDSVLEIFVKLLAVADVTEKIYGRRKSTYDDV